MPKIKAKQIRKMRNDPRQYVLAPKREQGAKPRDTGVTREIVSKTAMYFCPFCLFYGKLSDFQIKLKSGKISKRYQCQECKNFMQQRSLTENKTPEQYADWAFSYSFSGFWKKVPFAKFNERLRKLGMSYRFWKRYKELKGEASEEQTYEEHLMEEQEEWAREEGYIK